MVLEIGYLARWSGEAGLVQLQCPDLHGQNACDGDFSAPASDTQSEIQPRAEESGMEQWRAAGWEFNIHGWLFVTSCCSRYTQKLEQ